MPAAGTAMPAPAKDADIIYKVVFFHSAAANIAGKSLAGKKYEVSVTEYGKRVNELSLETNFY
jgi:hypothetical protein